jgi:two-component system response regulator CpxR
MGDAFSQTLPARGRSLFVFHSSGPVCGNYQFLRFSQQLCASGQIASRKWGRREVMRPRKTILCVDDNEQALSVRKFMLETRGYRVLTAHTSADALEIFAAGNVDLVLSDLIMPQMDGNELVRRMKSIAPEVPTIILSGSVKNFERASSADAFLPKGACTPLEVLERIRVMIARKRGPRKVLHRENDGSMLAPMAQDAVTAAG